MTVQTQLPATETSTRASGLTRWTTVAGLSLALALAVGVGLARISGDDSARTTERTAVSEAQPALPTEGTALGGAQRQIVYIAETQDQVVHALRFSAEINALRADLGQPLVSVSVLVAGSEGAMALEGLPGTPGTRFFDLRTP
jgi:hypothetical protein